MPAIEPEFYTTVATHVFAGMSPEESRQVALHGEPKALTPILSGAISGGIVGVSWIIGIVVWLVKRHRRARRARDAGFRSYREFLDPPKKEEAFIIPPDPAVIKGQVAPGEKIFEDPKVTHGARHARTVPMAAVEEDGHGEAAAEGFPQGMEHRASAPPRVAGSSQTHSNGTLPMAEKEHAQSPSST